MFLQDLQSKDVINVTTGARLGKITDLEIETDTGKINHLIISPQFRLSNLFNNHNNIKIIWKQIVRVGNEVIIVRLDNENETNKTE